MTEFKCIKSCHVIHCLHYSCAESKVRANEWAALKQI